jgi:NADH dehydrogenase
VVGDGSTLFSPVWIGDWVAAAVAILDDPALDGHIYQIGGPRKIRYEQMMDEIMEVTGIRRTKLHVPISLMRLPVLIMDRVLPNPPVAVEQLKMLRLDNSATDNATERLAGRPLRDFRDGIEFIKRPLREQKQHVMALAAGSSA